MAVRITVDWRGEELKEYAARQIQAGLRAVAIEAQRIAREMASVPNTGRRLKTEDVRRQAIQAFLKGDLKSLSGGLLTVTGTRKDRKTKTTETFSARIMYSAKKSLLQKTMTVYPYPSKPGEPPRRRTGFGQRNILKEVQPGEARVGFSRNARYMSFHEAGIRYKRAGMQRRPTLVPMLRNNQSRLRQLFINAANAAAGRKSK